MNKGNLINIKTQRRWTMLSFGIVFVAPLLFGTLLYCWRDHFHFQSSAKGEVLPPLLAKEILNIPTDHFLGKWQLVYFVPSSCDKSCEHKIELLQNLTIALGKDQSRVVLRKEPLIGIKPLSTTLTLIENSIVIIDPQGWLVTHYSPANFQAKGLLEDLRRLLRYSHVG